MAAALHITPQTVKNHLCRIRQKLNTNDRHQIPTILAQLPQTITSHPPTGVYRTEPSLSHNTPKSGNPLQFSINFSLSGHIPTFKTFCTHLFRPR
ncbi:helix-turn-helix transcriptional regulator [Chloroflexota bacterium]